MAAQSPGVNFGPKMSAPRPGTPPGSNLGYFGHFWREVDFCPIFFRDRLIKNRPPTAVFEHHRHTAHKPKMHVGSKKGTKPSPGGKFCHLERYWGHNNCLDFNSTFFLKNHLGTPQKCLFLQLVRQLCRLSRIFRSPPCALNRVWSILGHRYMARNIFRPIGDDVEILEGGCIFFFTKFRF